MQNVQNSIQSMKYFDIRGDDVFLTKSYSVF